MSEALVRTTTGAALEAPHPRASLPPVPWRDPHTVSSRELTEYIEQLERACLEHPRSADLRTCLGMARAMNFEIYKSMDALEEARALEPMNFWAQMKYAELHYRLRAIRRAEEETRRALELAENPWQLGVARRQLQEIRKLAREGARNVEWTKPLTVPVLLSAAMFVVMFVVMSWR
jgi:hypothetical protein